MYRATTPTHRFRIPIPLETIAEARICYFQNNREILSKKMSDCNKEGNNVLFVTLTQEETKSFSEGAVQIQLRIKTLNGDVAASKVYTTTCEKVLDDEVM